MTKLIEKIRDVEGILNFAQLSAKTKNCVLEGELKLVEYGATVHIFKFSKNGRKK